MSVYILHFLTPLKHANHYVGFASQVQARFNHHKDGTGAHITRACNLAGIDYVIARVWEGADRSFERKLKNTNNTGRYCPLCHKKPRDYKPKETK